MTTDKELLNRSRKPVAEREARLPAGWNEARVQRVIGHYESQTGTEAVAEDEGRKDGK